MILKVGDIIRVLLTTVPSALVITVIIEPSASIVVWLFDVLAITFPAVLLKVTPGGKALEGVVFRSSWEMVTDLRLGLPAKAWGPMEVTVGGIMRELDVVSAALWLKLTLLRKTWLRLGLPGVDRGLIEAAAGTMGR